jgi:hypothetical protein
MRPLYFLSVALAALLLCAGSVLAQSVDDNTGNVLYVQTDNYVVHTYGEYTNPVIEYWTRDQPNDKYKVWVDSIYEVAPEQSTPAPGKKLFCVCFVFLLHFCCFVFFLWLPSVE